jgi:hypothetical protein
VGWNPFELKLITLVYSYCRNLSTTPLYKSNEPLREEVKDLILAAGYGSNTDLENIMLNSIGYVNLTQVSPCQKTQDECFTTINATFYEQDGVDQVNWRSWYYQVCTCRRESPKLQQEGDSWHYTGTEYGYIQTGNTPEHILPLISRTLDLEYLTFFCKPAFNITTPPDLERVNKYGGFDIEYSRLAIIGGEADPWKPATPLADEARKRVSTDDKPVLLIMGGAVHHWEENGLFANETTPTTPPSFIVWAQQFEKNFVVEWMRGMSFVSICPCTSDVGFEFNGLLEWNTTVKGHGQALLG